jgi:hypothetical protein
MRINLRGSKTAVAEQLLNASNVRAAVEQVGGKTVPQRVRAGTRIEPGLLEVFFQQSAYASRGKTGAVLVQEEGGSGTPTQQLLAAAYPKAQGGD